MTTKFTRKGVKYIEINGEVVAKKCTACGDTKEIAQFSNDKKAFAGKSAKCKACQRCERASKSSYYRAHYRANTEYYRQYRQEHKEEMNANNRKWQHNNLDAVRIKQQRRRAMKRNLRNDLTLEQIDEILRTFDGKCALTGDSLDIHLDHFIPLATGFGGTTASNMIPLRADLNMSKNAENPFVWFKKNQQRFDLDRRKFDEMVTYLSRLNNMSVDNYHKYVYECFGQRGYIAS